ncbi:MAG: ABC transporter ATP-binding protein [Alphaproteobacteria bacterium]|nr:ABC transporter ATP-binding protein [Alphaproteobacteria bacterium]
MGLKSSPYRGAIALRGIGKRYGEDRVVDGLSLAISPGEFFTFLGPSGSGKTTTLMMIAGFASVDEGAIDVDGADLSAVPPQQRGFGMVFQNYAIFPHLNVFENVAFPLRARRQSEAKIRERVAWALELVQLGAFAGRYARQLSGGQQQRVAIARAIVFEPRIVLMDEPLGALDKNLRYDMQVEIKEIQRRLGMTVLYVTHDQEEAMNLSDRVAIMNRGRVEQVGSPSEVYERPANAFVGRFLGEANILEGVLERLDGDVATLRVGGLALRAVAREQVETGSRVSLFVRPERVRARSDADGNRLDGHVRRVSFLGNIVRYQVEVAPATHVVVDVQNSGRSSLTVDSPVSLGWSVEDSLVLTR